MKKGEDLVVCNCV